MTIVESPVERELFNPERVVIAVSTLYPDWKVGHHQPEDTISIRGELGSKFVSKDEQTIRDQASLQPRSRIISQKSFERYLRIPVVGYKEIIKDQ
jgi:hypothetical protein